MTMAFTKEQVDKMHGISMSQYCEGIFSTGEFGGLVVQINVLPFGMKPYCVGIYPEETCQLPITHDQFKDFDQALAFAIRLRDIYTRAQTEYEELVKEFSNK